MSDLQCAWPLLLFCAASISSYILRVVHPEHSFQFALRHDAGIRQCREHLLHIPITHTVWEMASLPFGIGGFSLRNAERPRTTAHWSRWLAAPSTSGGSHLLSLSQGRGGFHLEAAGERRNRLMNAADAPEWSDVDRGQRPGYHPDDEFPRFSRMGWQSSTEVEEVFFGTASILFHTPTVSATSGFDPQCFRVHLLRRLWCQLPLSSATCRYGQPLDSRGHHRGACATARILGRRGYPLEVVRHGSAGKQEQGCLSHP